MIRRTLLTLTATAVATSADAQTPDPRAGHSMPAAPAAAAADPHAGHTMPSTAAPSAAPADSNAGDTMPMPAGAPPAAATHAHVGHAMPNVTAAPPPVQADPHAGHTMPGAAAAPAAAGTDPHAGHMMTGAASAPPAAAPDAHAGHAMGGAGPSGVLSGAELTVGAAAPPPVITDNAADRVFSAAEMSRARDILRDEHGNARVSKVQASFLEATSGRGGGGYRWDVEGWYGGDINRFAFKTEGEGGRGEGLESAEVQALYSRAVTRYTDVQFGVRYDFEPRPTRAYATVGFDTLFPYWFEAEGALFLSEEGDLLGRLEGTYDLRLTQRLILQPQAELEFAARDVPELDLGSGVTNAELGLRLRYEIRREFAPYIGVSYERSLGKTADFIRARGDNAESTRIVAGIRTWF